MLLWTLGLSHRASSLILSGLKVMISFMTIWRDVQAEAQKIKKRNQWKRVRVLGLDGAYVLGWGEKQPVLVAVDLGTGEPITVGYINEYDPQAIIRWLRPLVQQHGISVIVTDDLSSYKIVAEKLQLGHQVCQFHVRRWVGKTLKDLQETIPKEWLWIVEEVRQLLDVLHPEGSQRLHALWKQLPGRSSRPDQITFCHGTIARFASALEPGLAYLLHFPIRTRSSLDQQCHRTSHWTHEDACQNRARLQILARHAIWLDVGWHLTLANSIPVYEAFCLFLFSNFAHRLCYGNFRIPAEVQTIDRTGRRQDLKEESAREEGGENQEEKDRV